MPPSKPAAEWSVLDRLAAQEHEKDQLRLKQQTQDMQQRLRLDLDRQRADVLLKADREKQENKQWFQQVEEGIGVSQEHEKQKEAAKKRSLEAVRLEREAQMASERLRKEQEKTLELQDAQAMQEQILAEGTEEQKRQQAQREYARKHNLAALQTGSENVKLRTEAQKRQLEEEQKSIERYLQMKQSRDQQVTSVKEQDQTRRDALEEEALRRNEVARKEEQDLFAKIEMQAAEERNKALRKDLDRFGKLRDKKLNNQAQLRQQICDKQDLKLTQKDELRQHQLAHENAAKRFVEQEQHKIVAKRQQHSAHQADLDRQARLQNTKSGPDGALMTDFEQGLNKQLLDRAICN